MANANLSPVATFVQRGYGQVEPNHLSAQRTGQIYAQLPAAEDITLLENGQFVKYDYKNGVVNFDGVGEWMLVYNEITLYRDYESDHDFAMIADNYAAKVYSPVSAATAKEAQVRNYNGTVKAGDAVDGNANPFKDIVYTGYEKMPANTSMVPRVFKTNVGDIFTTNTVVGTEFKLGDVLTPNAQGYLAVGEGDMKWEVVKIYTMPDGQRGLKLMRIA